MQAKPSRRVYTLQPPRDGDKVQARARVVWLIRTGRLPRPSLVPCTDCGHVWSPGERRHEYDHYLGYAGAHHHDVQAVCTLCHSAREDQRAPDRRARSIEGLKRFSHARAQGPCVNCGQDIPPFRNGRCNSCRSYWIKHGVDRTSWSRRRPAQRLIHSSSPETPEATPQVPPRTT